MKPIPAIVQSQHQQTLAAVRAARFDPCLGARIELGKALVAARALWPSSRAMMGGARGPGGATWLEWLESEGIAESTADRYMRSTGWTPAPRSRRPGIPTRRPTMIASTGTHPPRQCVYFMQAVNGGPIKIGMSGSPERRLSDLQIGSPCKLRIIGVAAGGQPREAALHRRLAAFRLHGEWFTDVPEVLAAIAEVLQ